LAWVTTPHPILVLPESGIKTVADLKGKRLLVVRRGADKLVDFGRATTLRTYETALATAGLTLEDVKLVELSNDRPRIDAKAVAESKIKSVLGTALSKRAAHRDILFALIRGEVDAITVAGPSSTDIKAFLGAHVVYDVGRDHPDRTAAANNGFPEALTVSGQLIEEHPDLVARVVARLLEAGEWAQSHPKEAVSFVAREQSVVDEIIDVTYGSELSQVFVTDLASDKIAALRSQKDYLLRHGYIKDFDFEAWIDPRPLAAARHLLAKRRTA
jgi:ABC-type nitrate/sulfonate/bicarbonate transport system substrate-binding protein